MASTSRKTHLAFGGLYGVRCRTSGKYGDHKISTDIEDVTCKRCRVFHESDQAKLKDVKLLDDAMGGVVTQAEFRAHFFGHNEFSDFVDKDNDTCSKCGKHIEIQIFRGTGYCSVDCQKALGLA